MSELRDRVTGLMPQALADLAELVAMRSVADVRQFPAEECVRAARWTAEAFTAAGVPADLHETPDGTFAVIGHRPAPAGAPTVLLYSHYDVQPPGEGWQSPPWELTERAGRLYGRGAADCKGNIIMHLTALRAAADPAVGVRVVIEGSEEQGTDGLEKFLAGSPELFEADAIVIGDTGNCAVGVPTFTTSLRGGTNLVVTVTTMRSALHSGSVGGAAPDALAALIHLLGTLRDASGNTTIRGLRCDQRWDGVQYPLDQFRRDAGILDGVGVAGTGTVSDMLWARPALTVLGIDCPPVVGSAAAVQPRAAARLNLRVPPGIDGQEACEALVAHLRAAAPWQARVEIDAESVGAPFLARTGGPAYAAMTAALSESYGKRVSTQGEGGSIPLCGALQEAFPKAEIMLIGVEEPAALIHAPDESVDPTEIEHLALAEALFLQSYGRQSLVDVQGLVEAAPGAGAGDDLHRTGLGVAAEEQVALTGQFDGLGDLAVGEGDPGAGGDIEAGLDDAVVAEGDADTGVRAEQAALAERDDLLAAAGQGAHDRRAAADVAAVADDDAGADPALDHGAAESAGVEVDEALVHDGGARSEVSTKSHARGIAHTHTSGY
ncbi:MAG: dipeptidase, partial [Streptosporangiaceae bacterium]